MATPTNVLTAVVPRLLAGGLEALRQNAVMPRLVNSSYSTIAGQKGTTIDVPVPSAIAAVAVDHANVAPNPGAVSPTSVPIAMNKWYEASFTLSDKEMLEAMEGIMPMQASEAVKALANQVDNSLFDLWSRIPNVVEATSDGIAFDAQQISGTDFRPKGMKDITDTMSILNKQLSPMSDRRFVIDAIGLGNLVQMRAFQDASWSADPRVITSGTLNDKLGFVWAMDQNLPKAGYTSGSYTPATGITVKSGTTPLAGATTVTVSTPAGAAIDFKVGDVITFSATGSGFHTIQSAVSAGASADAVLTFFPGLYVPLTSSHTVTAFLNTLGSSYTQSEATVQLFAFHRDCIAFATRPLGGVDAGLGSISSSVVDPVSGLTLRLEVTREYKRTRFSYDILWGCDVVRPEFGVRYLV